MRPEARLQMFLHIFGRFCQLFRWFWHYFDSILHITTYFDIFGEYLEYLRLWPFFATISNYPDFWRVFGSFSEYLQLSTVFDDFRQYLDYLGFWPVFGKYPVSTGTIRL